jgi:hypothetical protein
VFAAPSPAVSFFSSDQAVSDLEKTYAEPLEESSPHAPTSARSAVRETDQPKTSRVAPSLAVSFCSSVQVVPDLENTYTEPRSTSSP